MKLTLNQALFIKALYEIKNNKRNYYPRQLDNFIIHKMSLQEYDDLFKYLKSIKMWSYFVEYIRTFKDA